MQQPLIIRTQRDDLLLREVTMDDAEAICRLVNENGNPGHLSQWGDQTADIYKDDASTRRSIRFDRSVNGIMRMGIWLAENLAGSIYINELGDRSHAEIGYWLAKGYLGSGYATIAAMAFVSRAFEKEAYVALTANTHRENEPSWRLLERVGFRKISEGDVYFNYRLEAPEWYRNRTATT